MDKLVLDSVDLNFKVCWQLADEIENLGSDILAVMFELAPIPDLIDKKECDKIERKRRVRNERTKT